MLTESEKIAHLLRRFGLGAGRYAMAEYEPLGLEGAIRRLIEYDEVEDDLAASPWRFAFNADGNLALDAPRYAHWWSFRMLTTRSPLEEKLALFWHDHFAVSAQKVEFGPMMLEYLQAIHGNAAGSFRELLGEMAKNPAMIEWLDVNTSNRFSPNENFAREVMELFTMGTGYSEDDVREVARAFTGWAILPTFIDPSKRPAEEQIKKSVQEGGPLVLHIIVPYLRDDGEKTVLGRTAKFDADGVLDLLADRPETARHIAAKLWEWFAYPNPEPRVQERLARAFRDGGGRIKPVLRAIARSEEFYGERCVRTKVKSPVDFTVALLRQMDLGQVLRSLYDAEAGKTSPVRGEVMGAASYVTFTMSNQGLTLLYPPDVGGWEWGASWVNSGTMMERIGAADLVFGNERAVRPLTQYMAQRVAEAAKEQSAGGAVDAFLDIFDASIPAAKRSVLVEACEADGGAVALGKPETAAKLLGRLGTLLFATPEFHFC